MRWLSRLLHRPTRKLPARQTPVRGAQVLRDFPALLVWQDRRGRWILGANPSPQVSAHELLAALQLIAAHGLADRGWASREALLQELQALDE